MWYTQRGWMKELNTESAYRSMGGVTMPPTLPASWSSWELGGVWNHCFLHAGKRGKGLFGTWKNRNRRRETVQQGLCLRSQGRAWPLEASLASVSSRSWRNQNTDVCRFPGAVGCKHCFTSKTFLSGMFKGISWFWFWTTFGNCPRSWILTNSYHLLTSSRTW